MRLAQKSWGGKSKQTNLQGILVSQGERLLLQLCDFLLTLLAEASLLLRLGDGDRPGALGGRPAAAPRVLRGGKPLPAGDRRLPARASLHLQARKGGKVGSVSAGRAQTGGCAEGGGTTEHLSKRAPERRAFFGGFF